MPLPTLDEFITKLLAVGKWTSPNNSWVRASGFTGFYARVTQRVIENKMCWPVLDIANIEVARKGKGTFTNLILRLRKDYPALTIYVECVMTEKFCQHLRKMGFKEVPGTPNSFYMLPDK